MSDQQFDSPKAWRSAIFLEMFRLMHSQESDNFDNFRYPEAHRGSFFYDAHARYLTFVNENVDALHAARALLHDEPSRELFDSLILFRLLGHLHVRLPFNNPEMTRRLQVPSEWKVDDTGDSGMFGPLSIFSVPYRDSQIWVKGWSSNVAAAFLSGQYYFDRGGIRIAPEPGDHVIDGGGCFGDTALVFADDVGVNGRVYTFDPITKHCEIMSEAFQMNPRLAPRITIFDVGLAGVDRPRSTVPSEKETINPGARLEDGLPTRTIDSLVMSSEIDQIDFVKMDIEGSELGALQGGEIAIRRWRPRLAISLYHRPEDLFSIPLWLSGLGAGYRFFLDHYSIHNEETVLYAMPMST